jgi:hypothetical protein
MAEPLLVISTLPDSSTSATSPLAVYGTVSTKPLPQSLNINGVTVAINRAILG